MSGRDLIQAKKASPVTSQFLLEGAIFALEQCGLLLRDANVLYRGGSYASAVVLAAFAREELGRYKILLDLRRQVLAGTKFIAAHIQRRCDDHVAKQQAGMLSTTLIADTDSGLEKMLRARRECHPDSPESTEADAAFERVVETKKRRVPGDRHKSRMSALYVEPISEHRWNRPKETTAAFARSFLDDAANDYASQYRGYSNIDSKDCILRHLDAELCTALEQWSHRSTLHPPEWPGSLTEQ